MQKFLIIQTAFIGDVILATPLIEKLYAHFPEAKIDFLLRRGNESLLKEHPYLNDLIIWDKKQAKYLNLFKTIGTVRANDYDCIINLQRFFSTGLITVLSGSKMTIGFDKNPFSFLFSHSLEHQVGSGKHEVERNLKLIEDLTDDEFLNPKLYPNKVDYKAVEQYIIGDYICIAPTSVWYTKQFPKVKWLEFLEKLNKKFKVYLLGGPGDRIVCEEILKESRNANIQNLAGELSFLETSALMKHARMNYVNDSAPLHIASAVNAPTTAIFCSTVPAFGFAPLSDNSKVVETKIDLECRPCGLHGLKSCPKGHFKCAMSIEVGELVNVI